MVPVVFPEANVILGAPPDWDAAKDGTCDDLHTIRNEKSNTWTSLWRPSVEELRLLNNGGNVMLVIMSSGHPPVSVAVAITPEMKHVVAAAITSEMKHVVAA